MSDNSKEIEISRNGEKSVGWIRKSFCVLFALFGLVAVCQGIAIIMAKNVADQNVFVGDFIMPAVIGTIFLWMASRLWGKWLVALVICSLVWVVASVANYPNLDAAAGKKAEVEALYMRSFGKGMILSGVSLSLVGGLYLLMRRSAARSGAEKRLQASISRVQGDHTAKQRAPVVSEEVWICKKCIGKNPLSNTQCYLCQAPRPGAT